MGFGRGGGRNRRRVFRNFCGRLFRRRRFAMETGAVTCECIKCGYTTSVEGHCPDIVCPQCGGAMRRKNRPGPGKE